MISVKVSVSRDFGKWIDDIDRRKRIALNRKVQESLEYVKQSIAALAPARSGSLRNAIMTLPTTSVKTRGLSVMYGSGSLEISILLGRKKDEKIRWVNDRTGLFGPHRQLIRPKTAEFMIFKIDGQWIKKRTTKGQRGQKFIQRGIKVSKLIIKTKVLSALKS